VDFEVDTVLTGEPFSLTTSHRGHVVVTGQHPLREGWYATMIELDGEPVALAEAATKRAAAETHFLAVLEIEHPTRLGWVIAANPSA
jgi:frataxin-like iron-binding protein CyaY